MPVSVRVDKVPSAVLSVLSGPGATTGKGLVSHPLIRKVDITVGFMLRPLPGTTHIKAGTDSHGTRIRKHRWRKLCGFYC
jgi:hypothetical protein